MNARTSEGTPPRSGPRRSVLAAILGVILAGCVAESKVPDEAAEFKRELDEQIQTVDSLASALDERIEATIRRIEVAEALDVEMKNSLTLALARPGEVRTEIVAVVVTESEKLAADQAMRGKELSARLDEAEVSQAAKLRAQSDATRAALKKIYEFVHFFYTEQDSLNQALFARLDQKPWYTSIVSEWKEPQDAPMP